MHFRKMGANDQPFINAFSENLDALETVRDSPTYDLYSLAAQEVEDRQREKFVEKAADHSGDRIPRIDGWNEAFDYSATNSQPNN